MITQASIPESDVVPTSETSSQKEEPEAPVLGRDYITKEEAKKWVSLNAWKSREHFRLWEARLQRRWKELDLGTELCEVGDLDSCKTLFHDLEQLDPEASCLLTLEELEEASST